MGNQNYSDMFNDSYDILYIGSENLAVGEVTIPFKGRITFKQYTNKICGLAEIYV
jgi:hypothetical protein